MPKSTHSRRAQTVRAAAVRQEALTGVNPLVADRGTDPEILAAVDQQLNTPVSANILTELEAAEQVGEDVPDLSVPNPDEAAAISQAMDEIRDNHLEIVMSPGETCACGCGAAVNSTDRVPRYFRQGHDQRLIGILAQAAVGGREVGFFDGGMLVTGSAQQYGAKFLKDGGAAKLDAAIKRAVDKTTRRTTRATKAVPTCKHGNLAAFPCSQCEAEAFAPVGPQTGDEVKARIGRHVYFARVHGMNQAGKVTAVIYRTKAQPDIDKITEKFTIID